MKDKSFIHNVKDSKSNSFSGSSLRKSKYQWDERSSIIVYNSNNNYGNSLTRSNLKILLQKITINSIYDSSEIGFYNKPNTDNNARFAFSSSIWAF